ncbi:MAG: four helix bundle protein [candidate division NC10 bacterium]|jgi:four helix bundle protein|nr:four helix bundle protein [candidate division NC10 bacterium]
MKAQEFEELNVYQRARELTNRIYELTRDGAFARDFGLVDQVRRASVSIISNIAEGFERGTNAEFVQFLFIAKGSCGEVRTQVSVAFDQQFISKEDHEDLTDRCRRISAMLANLISYLRQPRVSSRRSQGASRKSLTQDLNQLIKELKEDS